MHFVLPEILSAGTLRSMSGFITRFTRASAVSFLGLAAVSVSHAITFDEWRAAHFTAAELADSSISGAAADPGHFGFTNLLRYTLSLGAPPGTCCGEAPQLPAACHDFRKAPFEHRAWCVSLCQSTHALLST